MKPTDEKHESFSEKPPSEFADHDKRANEDLEDRSLTIEWMTTDEAADYLRITPQALRTMTGNGKVRRYKLGRRNRYRKADLEKLLLGNPKGGFHGH